MKKYNLIVDSKVTVWFRDYVSIEANSLEEAIEMCKDGDYNDSSTEILYDTVEDISPEENDGCATLEIYDESRDSWVPVYSNGDSE